MLADQIKIATRFCLSVICVKIWCWISSSLHVFWTFCSNLSSSVMFSPPVSFLCWPGSGPTAQPGTPPYCPLSSLQHPRDNCVRFFLPRQIVHNWPQEDRPFLNLWVKCHEKREDGAQWSMVRVPRMLPIFTKITFKISENMKNYLALTTPEKKKYQCSLFSEIKSIPFLDL